MESSHVFEEVGAKNIFIHDFCQIKLCKVRIKKEQFDNQK